MNTAARTLTSALAARRSATRPHGKNAKTGPARDSGAGKALRDRALGLQAQGADDEAAAIFRSLLASNPNDPVAIYSMAALLMKSHDFDAALRLVERGVTLVPRFEPMWFLHAMVLQSAGRKEDALRSFDNALNINPQFTDALLNSGVLLREMHRPGPALERFNQMLVSDGDNQAALANCGIILHEFKKCDLAISMFARLLAINPDFPFIAGLLCYERLHACDWTDFDHLSNQIVDGVRSGKPVCKPFGMMAFSDSAEDQCRAAHIFAAKHLPKAQSPLWNGETYGHERLRIAYVSPDMREHPVGHLMAGVFERHDKTRFETYAISHGIDDGSRLRERMQKCFDHFFDVRAMSSRQIAELMRAHEIDIAVDLAGWTSDARIEIFTSRPAPLQVTYLGHPGTLGTGCMDYLIADRHVIPPEHQVFYSEKVAYLPDSYLPTDGSIQIAERTPSRAECGLPETGVVLCSFNHTYKIHPQMFAVWMRVMKRLPGSVLWLASRNEYSQGNLRAAALRHGVDPARLVFASRVPRVEDHLSRYRLADVFLDTWPYNAHTTAADALMAGLPVVTVMGGAFPGRVGGSLLHAIGLPELIAESLASYEELVVGLVSDRERLEDVKSRLAQNRATHALFNTDRFCRNLEGVLQDLAHVPAAGLSETLNMAPAEMPVPLESEAANPAEQPLATSHVTSS
jgi:predicted O-linked N-acetylglucosamine transferase (SPINDLY family)